MPNLRLRGARAQNLRDVDLDLPLGQWIAVTGPSGSGKSALVFETLVRAGQHRFLGALSARARQFFGKLGPAAAESITGLPAAVSVGTSAPITSSRSTVGTQTGALDLFRLLFAREAVDPGGAALTRSHFSFNTREGACSGCDGLGLEDRVDPELLIADPTRSIRDGALRPTLKNGYTVYSQVTLEVMNQICEAHGFDVETPWSSLSDDQRQVVLYGTKALKVPFGKHPIESRMKWEGITARPREEGYYRGLVPVIEETLQRNRNDNILRFVRSVRCPTCAGTRLDRPGREAALGGFTLPALLALPAGRLRETWCGLPSSDVLKVLLPSIDLRLRRMQQLGLAHLELDRPSASLSAGESQRLQLAAQLTAGLGRTFVALDEPTLGLHPDSQDGMREVLDELRDLGNTVCVVEHDPDMVRHADTWVTVGPGAGTEGGRVEGPRPLSDHPLGRTPAPKSTPRSPQGVLRLRGATLHNLDDADLDLHWGCLNVVLGPSGAGKSSLVFGTLLPALRGGEDALRGGPFRSLDGAPQGKVQAVDARPIGRNPRSTPATWSGLFDLVRKRFADTPDARARGAGAGLFSYNNKEGRCERCEGLGVERIGMHLLEDVELPCSGCEGRRYARETLEVRWKGLDIAEVLQLRVVDAVDVFADDPPLHALADAMRRLGLGHLQLGQPSNQLSRGEAQRVKLATCLASASQSPQLLLLDEPDRGLHPSDVERLIAAMDALVDAGHTLVAISHHRHLWSAADHLVEVREGTARSITVPDTVPRSTTRTPRDPSSPADHIVLGGVRTHNLNDVSLRLPHGRLNVIAGVSGSGKSSLAFATLAGEAWHRFGESLPFQVRRYLQRLPRADFDEAHGLGPTLALRQDGTAAGARSTVGSLTELTPRLRLLWSRAGTLDGAPCELRIEHFNPDRGLGACPRCSGRGVELRAEEASLITHPERALADGAMDGTRAGRFLGEKDGQTLAALAAATDDRVPSTPWNELSEAQRGVALAGAGDEVFDVCWRYQRGRRSGEHRFEGTWDGLLALAEREARRRANAKTAVQWRECLSERLCPECGGERLHPTSRAVEVGGRRLPDLLALSIDALPAALDGLGGDARTEALVAALRPDLDARLADLRELGLGHLRLDRRSSSLSNGELQRVRIASVLRSGLSQLTLVLDEPSTGLHPRDVRALLGLLRRFVAEGNTVVVVAHEPQMIRAADYLVELGPGSGVDGGRVVAEGTVDEVLAGSTTTARALSSSIDRKRVTTAAERDDIGSRLRVVGAHAHNLRDADLQMPARGFVVLTGVSGSGKSSLLFHVLEPSLRERRAVACRAIQVEGGGVDPTLDHFAEVRTSRWLGAGRVPLHALELMAPLQALFHGAAGECGLSRAAFSFASPAGRCPVCQGSGRETVALDFMADLHLPCPTCHGRRYRPEVLAVRWHDMSIADVLERPAESLLPQLRADAELGGGRHPAAKWVRGVEALQSVGLGALAMGRRRSELSFGESQRLTLAASLLHAPSPSVYLFDEPAAGLHEADLQRLIDVFTILRTRGDLVIAAEHRPSLIAHADWVVDLGPGSGDEGGRVISCGPPSFNHTE